MINTKKLFLFTIIFSFVFAQGKALNSARVYIKDKDWKQAEKFLLEALEHPSDKWEAAYHLGDKVYVRSQDWAKVKQYLDLAGQAPEKLKIRPTRNDSRVPISTAVTASKTRSYLSIFNRAAGYNSLLGRATDPAKREALLDMAIKEASFAKEFDPQQPGAYYLLSVFYSLKQDKENTLKNINLGLESDNIESRPLWKPMHMQPIFKQYPSYGGSNSEYLFKYGLCLPSGSNLSDEDLTRIVNKIKEAFEN